MSSFEKLFELMGKRGLRSVRSLGEKTEREIEEARYSLQRFSKELRDVSGYSSIHIDEFLTFADFVFDGLIADVWVQSKISKAKEQCDDAIVRVSEIKSELEARLN